ncbi:hypothetical protein V7183_10835 [Bacillus sp. JJ1127]|uniref:hypothetical protein n=1 Tax=Bacillus sp. JJ1127 TaxID=3122952 RepID=UPI002FFD5CE3
MRPGYKCLPQMRLYPSQTLFNMYADANDEKEVAAIYGHITNHDKLQHPDYIDLVDILGEEVYGPYNERGVQKRIDMYLSWCKEWGDD